MELGVRYGLQRSIVSEKERLGPAPLSVPTMRARGPAAECPAGLPLVGLPIVWSTAVVAGKVSQVASWLAWQQGGYVRCSRNLGDRLAVEYLAAWGVVPSQRGLLYPCPSCGQKVLSLRWEEASWVCHWCRPVPSWHVAAYRLAGVYQQVLLLGVYGRTAYRQARRLGRGLAWLSRRARTPWHLWLLAAGGNLLRVPVRWQWARSLALLDRRPMARTGPVWDAVARHLVPALMDELLHPDAYIVRFGEWLQRPDVEEWRRAA